MYTIVEKAYVTLLQSPLPPHLMLINGRLRQGETEFPIKKSTNANLQH